MTLASEVGESGRRKESACPPSGSAPHAEAIACTTSLPNDPTLKTVMSACLCGKKMPQNGGPENEQPRF